MEVADKSGALKDAVDLSDQQLIEETRATERSPILRYFSYGHLPDGPLRLASVKCYELAQTMEAIIPAGDEKTEGLRKLLEAKDCFVRAMLP